jgi:ABC-type nitrate/sulfonate/bicarbonate transport system permease component
VPRFPSAAILVALWVAIPPVLTAQSIAPPRSSPVWNAGSGAREADSTRHSLASKGWTQSSGAAAGGVIGVLAGLAVGLWRCRYVETYTGRRCGREVPRAAVLLGGLGLLMGWATGAGGEQHGK